MNWFIFAILCILGWGLADLFYKKGAEEDDKYSHYKQGVWVGLVMGVCAFALMPLAETSFSVSSLLQNSIKYTPASLSYIISMVVGYAGMRYLEISIISPVQNASGAFSMIAMIIFFAVTGRSWEMLNEFGVIDYAGLGFITVGIIALAIVEKRSSKDVETSLANGNKKYMMGAKALLFPLIYCLFDTIGTAADGIILDETSGLGPGEIDVIILYGLTFFIAGIVMWIILKVKTGKFYNPFAKSELPKCIAALCEEVGQVLYVFAMARNPLLAAPMVAGYCIVPVVLSRIFLKEKMDVARYVCIALVIIGILALGISEGLSSVIVLDK